MSMPYRVQRIEEFVKQVEVGDLKLRVRVLEVFYIFNFPHFTKCTFIIILMYFHMHKSERAARKATILQMATLHTVIAGTLVNIGVTFSIQGSQHIARSSFIVAGE